MRQVFDNIEYAGASAIAVDPWLQRPTEAETGSRMPDLHIDGHERLLTRPMWGKRELYVESFLAFEPNRSLYENAGYYPNWQPLPEGLNANLPHEMIDEAKRRGMQAHMGVGPFIPPDAREADRPVIINGSHPQPPLIARNVCLNSPSGQHYALAVIEDIRGYIISDVIVWPPKPETAGFTSCWI